MRAQPQAERQLDSAPRGRRRAPLAARSRQTTPRCCWRPMRPCWICTWTATASPSTAPSTCADDLKPATLPDVVVHMLHQGQLCRSTVAAGPHPLILARAFVSWQCCPPSPLCSFTMLRQERLALTWPMSMCTLMLILASSHAPRIDPDGPWHRQALNLNTKRWPPDLYHRLRQCGDGRSDRLLLSPRHCSSDAARHLAHRSCRGTPMRFHGRGIQYAISMRQVGRSCATV